MVLCEMMSSAPQAFMLTWGVIVLLQIVITIVLSGSVFVKYYGRPTYEKWRYKINPKFPDPAKVRMEIIQTAKGAAVAALPPAISLYLSQQGKSQAYCGVGEHGWTYLIVSFFAVWLIADLWEFAYHYLGHRLEFMWHVHKHHHVFFNPSPFAVIADEPVDQFFRALPMALFPMLVPLNMDMLFVQFGAFFYAYGVYLHWGYELDYPDAHHPWINTSYQHFAHHAVSVMKKPFFNGFYIRLWDNMMGSVYPEEKCFCSKCARAKGERSKEAWEKVIKPDYSVLLKPSFWISGK
eukprot:TRINITY_DN63523_c0_g1_i1.p1 TRINITY_DN63523_c0_g1~~TRINITY_DN63523_c0_g1_i1.p1  ORF type:complete len:318 (+),score=76.13 TRINITY_DN63523_c0_g1_i1:78-956(+)